MWDSYINRQYPKKYYLALPIVKDGDWDINVKYKMSGEGYIAYLIAMQEKFRHINFTESQEKTFAKAVDEFNYVNITLPIQKIRFVKDKKKHYDKLIEKGLGSKEALRKLKLDENFFQQGKG